MRSLLLAALTAALLAALPVFADGNGAGYKIDYDGNVGYKSFDTPEKKGLYGTVKYKLSNPQGVRVSDNDEIVIYEDGKEVKRLPLRVTTVKKGEPLTSVLALDVSASMGFENKLGEAKRAAGQFLDVLGHRMDTGLILFDHEVKTDDPNRFRPPSGNHNDTRPQTELIRKLIGQAQPLGGSAYRNATAKAIDMLKDVRGNKAVVLMTDGVDVNSQIKLADLIRMGVANGVPVYTVGIGAPGLNTVLVLDQSGSMAAPANDRDRKTKIQALHEAGTKFVELMRPGSMATLVPFSTDVTPPRPFTGNQKLLIDQICSLQPEGGTSLYDATMVGVETLVAANPAGNRVVVVLTDGKDESPGSRYSDQAVIDRAREVGIKLYMLGLGRKKEINETVMKRMARQSGGEYFYVESADTLIQTFEKLSTDLNDMGALKELAEKTGGKYYRADNVAELQLRFKEVAEEVKQLDERDYDVEEFKSARDVLDGTARKIRIVVEGKVVVRDASGKEVVKHEVRSDEAKGAGNVRGLVVPEQSPVLYLILLGCVVGGLVLPQGLRVLLKKPN